MFCVRHGVPSRKESSKPPLSDEERKARLARHAACMVLRSEGVTMDLSGNKLARFVKERADKLTAKILEATKGCVGDASIHDLFNQKDARFTN